MTGEQATCTRWLDGPEWGRSGVCGMSLPCVYHDDYEGLRCALCGTESGNTDTCVPCALRSLRRAQEQGS